MTIVHISRFSKSVFIAWLCRYCATHGVEHASNGHASSSYSKFIIYIPTGLTFQIVGMGVNNGFAFEITHFFASGGCSGRMRCVFTFRFCNPFQDPVPLYSLFNFAIPFGTLVLFLCVIPTVYTPNCNSAQFYTSVQKVNPVKTGDTKLWVFSCCFEL